MNSIGRPFVLLALLVAGCKGGPDAQIAQMATEVNPDHCRRIVETLAGFGTRHTMSSQDDEARGIGAARRWLLNELEQTAVASGGRLEVAEDSFMYGPDNNRITRPTRIVNLVATLPGTQAQSRDRLYVVSAHYDSICNDPKDAECDAPGADDDASGVAVVLELARIMSPRSFDATIVFMLVAGEEQGLIGSRHWAEQARRRGLNVAGMFTNDIVGASTGPSGRSHAQRVRVFSEGVPSDLSPEQARQLATAGGENDSASRQLARFVHETTVDYLPGFEATLIFRRDRYLRGGDHLPFLDNGYPAIRFTEYEENYDHQHQTPRKEDGREFGDLPRHCDFRYIANVARANLVSLATLARAPAVPENCRLMTTRLTNDTSLRWDRGAEPDLAGYEVVWRSSTAPTWEHVERVGDACEVTLPISKDNVFFGVRAVDRAGHRSPAATPRPARE